MIAKLKMVILMHHSDLFVYADELSSSIGSNNVSKPSCEETKEAFLAIQTKKLEDYPNFQHKLCSHKSFHKGRSSRASMELVNLILEDLDFMDEQSNDPLYDKHRLFRLTERLGIFYADREPPKDLIIPSPCGLGFLQVSVSMCLTRGICATLYRGYTSEINENYLVLRGTAIFPKQSCVLETLIEDCHRTIGKSCRKLSQDQLKSLLPHNTKPVLIGMSLGGAQAMILYSRFPQLFKELITLRAPYVGKQELEHLKKNCHHYHLKPKITAIQAYDDLTHNLGAYHLGASLKPHEAQVDLYLLKSAQNIPTQLKQQKGLFNDRIVGLKKRYTPVNLLTLLKLTLHTLFSLKDAHQAPITRDPYVYEHLSNRTSEYESYICNQDFKRSFEKFRKRLLFPIGKGLVFLHKLLNKRSLISKKTIENTAGV